MVKASSQTDLALPNNELSCSNQHLISFDTCRFLADSARDGSDDEGETDVNGGGGAFRGGNRGFGGRGGYTVHIWFLYFTYSAVLYIDWLIMTFTCRFLIQSHVRLN